MEGAVKTAGKATQNPRGQQQPQGCPEGLRPQAPHKLTPALLPHSPGLLSPKRPLLQGNPEGWGEAEQGAQAR